ncbi:unnamed protein product [Orchesella dallaii]|uniref:Uncharacterized protein n=1 Tax=Orchesella dallaii TaxID=48710 RepID=A0ABP1RIT9_9HEXA
MMAESTSTAEKKNAEVLWFKRPGCSIWHPVERLKEEDLTENMKKQRNEFFLKVTNNSKKKQKEILKNETNDTAYVVQYFTPGDFHVLGKRDNVKKNVTNEKILAFVAQSISCMKKYSRNENIRPGESMSNLEKRLLNYAEAVIFFLPSSGDSSSLFSLFEREIPGFGSEMGGEGNEPIPSTSRAAAASNVASSAIAAPSETHSCNYCSYTASRLGTVMAHMTYCPERKRRRSLGPSRSHESATSMVKQEGEALATATPQQVEQRLAVVSDPLRGFVVEESMSGEEEVRTGEENTRFREVEGQVETDEQEEVPKDKKEEVTIEEQEEVQSDEQEEVPDEEQEEMSNDNMKEVTTEEQEEMPNDKKEEGTTEEQEEVQDEEQEEVQDEEQEEIPDEEQEEMPNDKKEEGTTEEQEEVQDEEQEEVSDEEQEEMPNDNKKEVTTDEQEEVPSDEQEDVSDEEQEEMTNDNKKEVPTDEQEEMPTDQKEKLPASEKLVAQTIVQEEQKTGCPEETQTGGEEVSTIRLDKEMQPEEEVQRFDGIKEPEKSVDEPPREDSEPGARMENNESESKPEKTPALIANRYVHMVPMEQEDGSIDYMILSMENMSEQPNVAYQPGEIDPGSSIIRMDKVTPIDSNERVKLKHPDRKETVFLDKPVQEPGDLVRAFLDPDLEDNVTPATPPTVHNQQELGAQAQVGLENLQAEARVTDQKEEREVSFYVDARTGLVYFADWASPEVREAITNAQVCYAEP